MAVEETVVNLESLPNSDALKEMMDAGVYYGRKKTKTNPKVKSFILANRGGVEIIDLNRTLAGIESAVAFVKEKALNGALFLVVGTQPPAVGIVSFAKEFNFPYVCLRWIGGTLTNFKTIFKRIEYYKKLREDLASGALAKYTKKERLNAEREIRRSEELFGGLENLNKLPEVVIIIDPQSHRYAVREARKLGIPIVALANTDADPDLIDYPVIGNTAARKGIEWFLGKIGEAIRTGRLEAPKDEAKAATNVEVK